MSTLQLRLGVLAVCASLIWTCYLWFSGGWAIRGVFAALLSGLILCVPYRQVRDDLRDWWREDR